MNLLLGSIVLATSDALTGPVSASSSKSATIPQYAVNRGKPIPHIVGDELETRSYGFFFDETFCNVPANLAKLEAAYASKSPLPLVVGNGISFRGTRFIVDSLDVETLQENMVGNPVRVEGYITLLEDPLQFGLGGLLDSIAKGRAIARSASAGINALIRRR